MTFDALIESAKQNLKLDQVAEALALLGEALRLRPDHAGVHVLLGQALRRNDDHDAALASFGAALKLEPKHVNALFHRAALFYDREELERALYDFNAALALEPDHAGLLGWRALVWDELGEYQRADEDEARAESLRAGEDNDDHDDDEDDDNSMNDTRTLIHPLLHTHFEGRALEALTITERRFPGRVRANLQRAIDSLVEEMKPAYFCGVRKRYQHQVMEFSELLVRDRNDPALAVPPQYEELDIGAEAPMRCLKSGLWLLEAGQTPLALLLIPGSCDSTFQIATVKDDAGDRLTKKVFQHLEDAVHEARCYRGKVLSFEMDSDYSGVARGIRVHRLHPVAREQMILPPRTLELLERNVLRFVGHRKELARRGLATKKGLLFYGPPGTGKTHTIHYLAGALAGVTTLIISAEQVGLLDEYMTLARLLQPSLVVIEDADLIARNREHMNSPVEEVLLNKLLNHMDGLREDADILFVLTSNRPEALEAALASRPGRIDQAIEFPFPDEDGRRKLVRLYARGADVSDEVVISTARRCERVSAAFIKELMRRATQFQLERDPSDAVRAADVDAALDELVFKGGSLNRKLLGGEITV